MELRADLDGVQVWRADALDLMRSLDDDSVGLICTDPPYFKVKAEWWDRQWSKPEKFLEWVGEVLDECQRVLRPNGSLYFFASPKMAWHVEGCVRERFNVLTRISWNKYEPTWAGRAQQSDKAALRSPFPSSEVILFAEHFNSDNIAKGEAGYVSKCDELRGFVFEPLRAYLDGERRRAGVTPRQCNEACGTKTMAGHYFATAQWALPTERNYEKLRALLNSGGGDYLRREYDYLRREYDELRREYDELRREYDELRRPFNATPEHPYTDVWTFKTVGAYRGKHPCEKPADLIDHIMRLSGRKDFTVLDPFAGSGQTLISARRFGYRAIGCDIDEKWATRCAERLAQPILRKAA